MKTKTAFICQNCGTQSPKWLGRCPSCGEWDTMIEEVEEEVKAEYSFPPSEPLLYEEIEEPERERIKTRIDELNRVFGGGVVLGSLVLIGGEPGIGKSTLLLQVCRDFSILDEKVLYVSGEESLDQIKIRGERLGLGLKNGKLYLLAETNLERIISQAETLNPQILVLDSVQTVFSSKLSSTPGTISQVREVASQVFRFAKKNQVSSFLVGHITKEGSLAGPKSLEHVVDVVLYFEGERDHSHRVLRALKNRFGPVSEVAIFEMGTKGLQVVTNPSAFFLRERPEDAAGSAVICTIKGSRPLLAEIQALVSSTLFTGNPRRMTIGLDHFRTSMLLAIVEKKLGFSFAGEDIYINVAGGLAVDEPAADLGVMMAVVSCLKNKAIPPDLCIFGEVGLSGEVRSVSQALARVKEAHSLGFKKVVLPQGNFSLLEKEDIPDVKLMDVQNIKQAVGIIF
ncbi:MAG: DNA repair protein RadA [Candidatus Aminicenantes bacterium]|nr:MAG: DNA repair protein RadA [Candidatus Aminicenantes bacterium]